MGVDIGKVRNEGRIDYRAASRRWKKASKPLSLGLLANMSLRKISKTRSAFPSDEALLKLFYLALRNISAKWNRPLHDWKAALNRFT
jgi:transposase-like protein